MDKAQTILPLVKLLHLKTILPLVKLLHLKTILPLVKLLQLNKNILPSVKRLFIEVTSLTNIWKK